MPTQNLRDKSNVEAIFYLTALQEGMLSYGLGGGRDPYYTQKVFELDGAFDEDVFWDAWQTVIRRHPVLRTDLRWKELDRPVQVVYREAAAVRVTEDWCELSGDAQTERLAREWQGLREQGYRFDRSADLDVRLIRVSPSRHWFVWRFHHIKLDGWSFAMVLGEVLQAYAALTAGRKPRFAAAPGFQQYVKWTAKQDDGAGWWRTQLAGLDAPTRMPLAINGQTQSSDGFGERALRLSVGRSAELMKFARSRGLTLNTLLQGAWAWLLAEYSGERDVIFGVTVSGRPGDMPDVERIAGLFINTLPCRVSVRGTDSLVDWLRSLQGMTADISRYAHHSLSMIRRDTGWPADLPLFETAVVFENFPVENAGSDELPFSVAALAEGERVTQQGHADTTGRNHYPLSLIVVPGDELQIMLAYDCRQVSHETARVLLKQMEAVLVRMIKPGVETVAQLSPAIAASTSTTLAESAVSLLSRVQQHAEQRSGAPALQYGNEVFGWSSLWEESGRFAQALRTRGVKSQDRVAVSLGRVPALVVSLLAIWRLGAVYVPLDRHAPPARLAWQTEDCGARCLVAESDVEWRPQDAAYVHPDTREESAGPLDPAIAQHYAYLIYTSGSTGRPKGVAVTHAAVSAYLAGVTGQLPGDIRSAAYTSTPAADLGHTVLFGALWHGWTLHLINDECLQDPDQFAEYMRSNAVDALKIVPAHFSGLLHAGNPADVVPARCLILGGDSTSHQLVERVAKLKPACRIISHYGPTETTIGVVAGSPNDAVGDTIALGYPLAGASIHILNEDGNPSPVGAPGEIHVGGRTVAACYWGQPARTAERFIPDPWSSAGARMYRTGDYGRRLPDGQIQFLGRRDDQIKIRGYRVEPEEIAGVLRSLNGVRDAVVLVNRPQGHEPVIAAYVCGNALDAEDLRGLLTGSIPAYMMPATITVLDQMPLTANGKVDRQALAVHRQPESIAAGIVAPCNATEEKLLAIWSEVLGRTGIGVDEHFLEAGGDSILSLQIIARARRAGMKIIPKDMLAHPTIAQMAAHVDRQVTPARTEVAATLQSLIESVK
jgi:amino acid adenylation domain-containing protein